MDFDEEWTELPSELPGGGDVYDVELTSPLLGVMFFRSYDLAGKLLSERDVDLMDMLGSRPVVAHMFEKSAAERAGVKIGDVLTRVEGTEVSSPNSATRLVTGINSDRIVLKDAVKKKKKDAKQNNSTLRLSFYVPEWSPLLMAEGEMLVCADDKSAVVPKSIKGWKYRHVVIGDLFDKDEYTPWTMKMYKSKVEYDKCILEKRAQRKNSIKCSAFPLDHARILKKDGVELQDCQYENYKLKKGSNVSRVLVGEEIDQSTLYYFIIQPGTGNPIKLGSFDKDQAKVLHKAVQRIVFDQFGGSKPSLRRASNESSDRTLGRTGAGNGRRGSNESGSSLGLGSGIFRRRSSEKSSGSLGRKQYSRSASSKRLGSLRDLIRAENEPADPAGFFVEPGEQFT